MALETEDRNLIVAAAVKSIVGPAPVDGSKEDWAGYNADLHAATLEVLDAAGERSVIAQTLDRIAESKHFVGVITDVHKEEKSERVVIELKKDNGDDDYPVRTNRFDDWTFGGPARALANKAKKLIGNRVLLTVRLEVTDKNAQKKVRVVENIRDLGKPRDND